jgi:hypothetical protein
MVTLNSEFPLRDQGASNALALDSLPRHRWYFVKEGFSPKLVEQAVATEGIRHGEVLFDPFSGSGTVPLTGALHGLRVSAFEVNPFLRFLSATKLLQGEAVVLRKAARGLIRPMKKPIKSPLEGYSTFTEGNRWERWLFPTPVLGTFEACMHGIKKAEEPYRSFLRLAAIAAAMDCCNATRDGKCLRYHREWRTHEANALQYRKRFDARIEMIANDLQEAPLIAGRSWVKEGDARRLLGSVRRQKFRLCVTSPPYLNSFDYSDIYRPELFLGGFVDSTAALMKIRLKTVRSHVQASWKEPIKKEFGSLYQRSVSTLAERAEELWDPRIPKMVQAYFEDMETILTGLRQIAHPNASVWLVVSTSAYASVEVPVDLILAELSQRCGWFLREVGVLRYLRSSSQHVKHVEDHSRKSVPLRESVVILDASRPSKKGNTRPRR